jgi:YHS domain-containing protein
VARSLPDEEGRDELALDIAEIGFDYGLSFQIILATREETALSAKTGAPLMFEIYDFCSPKCFYEWRRSRVELICDHCGNIITKSRSAVERREHHFCSRKCYYAWLKGPNNPKRQRAELTCDHCGTPITRKKSDIEKAKYHFCSTECKYERLTGPNHPRWRGGRAKLTCDQCGAPITRRRSRIEKHKHHFCSQKCYSEWLAGPNSPHWRGGVSFEPYSPEFNKALKRRIRERDKYTCAICGGSGQQIHHIDGDKGNNDETNLITLCNRCHGHVTVQHKEWEPYLQRMVKTRYSLDMTKGEVI